MANERFWAGAVICVLAAAPARAWLDWTRAKDFQQAEIDKASAERRARELSASWPRGARLLAWRTIGEYGPPDEALPYELSWRARGPWSRIEIWRDPAPGGRPGGLLQAVSYDASGLARDRLASLRCGVFYNPVSHELVSRSDDEQLNLLALNIADEVLRGRRDPETARAFYDLAVELSYSGKSSRYMRGLLFKPASAALQRPAVE